MVRLKWGRSRVKVKSIPINIACKDAHKECLLNVDQEL